MKRLVGIASLAGTAALGYFAFAEDVALAAELFIPASIALAVLTFTPSARALFPWAGAYQRWQERRLAAGIAELEDEVIDSERVVLGGDPYRAATFERARRRPGKRVRARRSAVAAAVGSLVTVASTLAIAAYLPYRGVLAIVMLISGMLATLVLSALASMDTARAEARERLRVEEGVRRMEARLKGSSSSR